MSVKSQVALTIFNVLTNVISSDISNGIKQE